MSESIEAIDERFFHLQLHYNELMAKCETPNQEAVVDRQFTDASTCHDNALSRIFDENAAAVVSLRTALESNTGALKQQMAADEQIVTILNTMTAGGQLAQELLGKGQQQ